MAQATTDEVTRPRRFTSVDALRGFAMVWIVGGQHVGSALKDWSGGRGPLNFIGVQLDHSLWQGLTFFDLVFPLFLFVVGVSLVFSLGRMMAQEGVRAAHRRILRRFVLLFLLGILYNGGLTLAWPEVRLLGVLQRIAICYAVAGLLFCHVRLRGLIVAFVLSLGVYWALMTFVPPPGQPAGVFAPGRNLANYVDLRFLPGLLPNKTWDADGLLSTLPSVGTCLLGVFAGLLLTHRSLDDKRKALYLAAGGLALVVLGHLWGLQFPIIKALWTSSYVLATGGYSLLLLSGFYLVIDMRNRRTWALPFIWVGMNAIVIFFLPNIVSMHELAQRIVGGSVERALGGFGPVLTASVGLSLVLLVARFLYRRQIFLRI